MTSSHTSKKKKMKQVRKWGVVIFIVTVNHSFDKFCDKALRCVISYTESQLQVLFIEVIYIAPFIMTSALRLQRTRHH